MLECAWSILTGYNGDSSCLAAQNADTQLDIATMLAIPVAQHGHAHIIHLLDEYGAEWEEIDPSRGGPALMHAANNGHSGAVTALLEVPILAPPHACHC